MFNKSKKVRTLCRQLSGILLCASLLFQQSAAVFAAAESADAPIVTATPTPEPHSEYYNQAAETDSIANWPAGPQIEAASAVLMDLDTGTVLYAKNGDSQQYPASITKIMTAWLACQYLDPTADLVVSQSAAYGIESGSSSIYAETDEKFTVEQALMAVMLESANEMALAVAEETSGSVKKFVELMNETAAKLGCENTHFNNPNGLPDETHYTTANDMAKIARAAWSNARFRSYTTTQYYEIPPTNKQPETRYFQNHHKMMTGRDYAYDGVLGGKTGYTEVAGNTLVTYASKNGLNLVAVVLQGINGAYSDTAALLDYGFNNFTKASLTVEKNPVPVKILPSEKYILANGGNTYPFYSYESTVYVTVPKDTDLSTLTTSKTILPCSAGPDRLQTTYYLNDHPVGYSSQYEKEILSDLLL